MTNDLVSTVWTPPEAETTKKIVRYGTYGALVLGALAAFLVIGPTVDDAIILGNKILVDGWHMAMYGTGLWGTVTLLHSLLSSNGRLNKAVQAPFDLAINAITNFCVTINPLLRLDKRIEAVRADQALFEAQYQKMYGIVENLHQKENKLRALSTQSQHAGIAANRLGKQDAADLAAYKFGSSKDAADALGAMRARLEPILTTFSGISHAADITAQKLEFDRDNLKVQWDAQASVRDAVGSANRILGRSKSQTWKLAEQADEFISTKYAEELGHLEYLKKTAQPFMDSIDIETGTYSEEMLAGVQKSGAQLAQSTNASMLPLSPIASLNAPNVASDALAGFLPH